MGLFHWFGSFHMVSNSSFCGPSTSLYLVSMETLTFMAPFNMVLLPQFDSPLSLSSMMISPYDLAPSPSQDQFVSIPPLQWDSMSLFCCQSPLQSQDLFVANSPLQWDSPLFGSFIGSYQQPSEPRSGVHDLQDEYECLPVVNILFNICSETSNTYIRKHYSQHGIQTQSMP